MSLTSTTDCKMRVYCTFNSVGREETQILGLQRVLVCKVDTSALRLRLSSQGGVVHLETTTLDDSDVRRDPVSELNLHHVSEHNVLCAQCQLLTLSDHCGKLCTQKAVTNSNIGRCNLLSCITLIYLVVFTSSS